MEKNKGGRPRKEIDYETVEKLSSLFCTQKEIASFLDLSLRKLQNDEKFMHIYKRGQNNAKTSLRRYQFKSAEKGNVTMQIWLGKQYLDQKEPAKIEEVSEEFKVQLVDDIKKEVNNAG